MSDALYKFAAANYYYDGRRDDEDDRRGSGSSALGTALKWGAGTIAAGTALGAYGAYKLGKGALNVAGKGLAFGANAYIDHKIDKHQADQAYANSPEGRQARAYTEAVNANNGGALNSFAKGAISNMEAAKNLFKGTNNNAATTTSTPPRQRVYAKGTRRMYGGKGKP